MSLAIQMAFYQIELYNGVHESIIAPRDLPHFPYWNEDQIDFE